MDIDADAIEDNRKYLVSRESKFLVAKVKIVIMLIK